MKEKELASSQHVAAEANLRKDMAALRDQVDQLQQRLTSAEEEASGKLKHMQNMLNSTQQVFVSHSQIIRQPFFILIFFKKNRNLNSTPN